MAAAESGSAKAAELPEVFADVPEGLRQRARALIDEKKPSRPKLKALAHRLESTGHKGAADEVRRWIPASTRRAPLKRSAGSATRSQMVAQVEREGLQRRGKEAQKNLKDARAKGRTEEKRARRDCKDQRRTTRAAYAAGMAEIKGVEGARRERDEEACGVLIAEAEKAEDLARRARKSCRDGRAHTRADMRSARKDLRRQYDKVREKNASECGSGKSKARADAKKDIEKAEADVSAVKADRKEMRARNRAAQPTKKPAGTARAREVKSEIEDAVRHNLPKHLHGYWDLMKGMPALQQGTADQRTERFMELLEEDRENLEAHVFEELDRKLEKTLAREQAEYYRAAEDEDHDARPARESEELDASFDPSAFEEPAPAAAAAPAFGLSLQAAPKPRGPRKASAEQRTGAMFGPNVMHQPTARRGQLVPTPALRLTPLPRSA